MSFKKFCTVALLSLSSTSLMARNKSLHDQFTGQGYGMAGCGLGSIIFGDKPGGTQVFASTTNGTFGSQTFGISSGTSNCEDHGSGKALTSFVHSSRHSLENDAAKGSGESLKALSSLLNYKDSNVLAQKLKANYGKVFAPSNSDEQVAKHLQALAHS